MSLLERDARKVCAKVMRLGSSANKESYDRFKRRVFIAAAKLGKLVRQRHVAFGAPRRSFIGPAIYCVYGGIEGAGV